MNHQQIRKLSSRERVCRALELAHTIESWFATNDLDNPDFDRITREAERFEDCLSADELQECIAQSWLFRHSNQGVVTSAALTTGGTQP